MTKKQKHFFKHAKAASEMSSFPRVHIGCVVSCGSKVMSAGFNTSKTAPIQKKYNQYRNFDANSPATGLIHSLHAEISALNQLKYSDVDFSKCEVWTYREDRNGNLAKSRPCPGCLQMIKDLKIKKIHYTTNEGFVDEEIIY